MPLIQDSSAPRRGHFLKTGASGKGNVPVGEGEPSGPRALSLGKTLAALGRKGKRQKGQRQNTSPPTGSGTKKGPVTVGGA